MRGMPFVPLDPQWIAESPAFQSSNPAVVRACLKLLSYAWTAVPAGTVPVHFKSLAGICGLSEEEVAEHHDDLFEGWVLVSGRMQFPPMYAVCERISSRYKDVLANLADQSAVVMQAPEEFELTATEAAPSATKGKRRLPKGWSVSPDLSMWLTANGYTDPMDINFVTEKFTSHFRATGELRQSWDDSFRNFVMKENRLNLPSSRIRVNGSHGSGASRAQRFGSAGVAAEIHNGSALAAAAQRAAERQQRHG